jgi:hypothetical protein
MVRAGGARFAAADLSFDESVSMPHHPTKPGTAQPGARTENGQEHGPPDSQSGFVMERFGRISDADRSFDIHYWQRQGDAAIYTAAWELVELYHESQGKAPDELRLQKSLEHIQRA